MANRSARSLNAAVCARRQLNNWAGVATMPQDGLFYQVFQRLIALINSIVDGGNDQSIEALAAEILDIFSGVHEVMVLEPFNSPSLDQLEKLRQEFAQLRLAPVAVKEEPSVSVPEALSTPTETLDAAAVERLSQLGEALVTATVAVQKQQPMLAAALQESHTRHDAFQESLAASQELGRLCATLASTLKPPAPEGNATAERERLEVMVERWKVWLQEIRDVIQDLDNERDTVRAALEEVADTKRFGAVNGQGQEFRNQERELHRDEKALSDRIDRLVQQEKDGKASRDALRARIEAIDLLQGSLTEAVWQLPEIALEGPPPMEQSEPAAQLLDDPFTSDASAYDRLEALAQRHGLRVNTAFILTLFDLLLPKQGSTQIPQKGVISVLAAARAADLLSNFGWQIPHEVLKGWDSDSVQQFLTYRGSPRKGVSIFCRTGVSLPWQACELFSADEIDRFRQHLQSPHSAR